MVDWLSLWLLPERSLAALMNPYAAPRAATKSPLRTSSVVGRMVLTTLKLVNIMAGHLRRTWAGVSAFSRHSVQRAAAYPLSLHPSQSLVGFLPIRCR